MADILSNNNRVFAINFPFAIPPFLSNRRKVLKKFIALTKWLFAICGKTRLIDPFSPVQVDLSTQFFNDPSFPEQIGPCKN